MSAEPVRFDPVADDSDEPADASELDEVEGPRRTETPAREADRERFPLAGPILEGSRPEVLRGRCSSCDARLRVRLEEDRSGSVRVRCPICGNTREIDA